ncbi:MAG: nucleotide exchange factor GrpE [Deltaproteobacteria bacterium]|nr:nucleotide exchange factor GrpE [Deltaproteobacteria bacterium]
MAENDNEKLNIENPVESEDVKKSEECLKDSIRFEDFAATSGEQPPQEVKGEVAPKAVSIEEYERLKKELLETKDYLLRVAAEFENYKKRVAKEKEDLLKFANESILRDLLETADNLELTLLHSRQASNKNEEVIKGFEITVKGFLELLKRYGVVPLEIEDKAFFDPNFHEAIGVQESETIPSGQIIKVERKGYMIRDRLLRPAFVIVSKGKPDKSGEEDIKEGDTSHKCIAEPEPKGKDE